MDVIVVSRKWAAGQGRPELRWPLVRLTTDGHRMTVETRGGYRDPHRFCVSRGLNRGAAYAPHAVGSRMTRRDEILSVLEQGTFIVTQRKL